MSNYNNYDSYFDKYDDYEDFEYHAKTIVKAGGKKASDGVNHKDIYSGVHIRKVVDNISNNVANKNKDKKKKK